MTPPETQQVSMMEETGSDNDHYAEHLAAVNENNDVTSTEDIHNKHGVLVVPKGARIDKNEAGKILRHKLLKPLDGQIQLDNAITAEQILDHYQELFSKYSDLHQIHKKLLFEVTLKKCVMNLKWAPLILQKLTVMFARMKEDYYKGLFTAWLSALIAQEMRTEQDFILDVFIAGLIHDIGMLHINPEILNKEGSFSAEEWRALQSHVVVGYMFVKNISTLNPRIARAIQEHHERCDGSGYLSGKTDEELDVMGQIVGMADSIEAIYLGKFVDSKRNMRDLMPYLHMNTTTHFLTVYKAMCSILNKSSLEPTDANPFKSLPELVSHLQVRGLCLKNAVELLHHSLNIIPELMNDDERKKLVRVIQPVIQMITTSGLVRDEIFSWLENIQAQPDNSAQSDLVEMELMQNELYWQLKKVCRAIVGYVDKEQETIDNTHKERLEMIADKIKGFIDKRE